MSEEVIVFVKERGYRGRHCTACGWDASFQPPEVTACTSCGGVLRYRYAVETLTKDESRGQPT